MNWLRSTFANLTVRDQRTRTLLRYPHFYHLTPRENVESILSNGLDPERCAQPNVHGPYQSNFVCLTTECGIDSIFTQKDDGMGGLPDLALIEVPSFALTGLTFDADQTHVPIRHAVSGDEFCSAEELPSILSCWYYIVVLDKVGPKHIRKIDIQPFLSAYNARRA